MRSILKNQIGSSMVQVMVAGAVLLGTGVYLTKSLKSQESINKSTSLRFTTSRQVQEITEALTDWEVCKATLAQNSALSNNSQVNKIVNKDNVSMYEKGFEIRSGKITEMLLTDYTPSAGLRYNKSTLRVTMEFKEKRGGGQNSFGGTHKSYKIPLYLITLDNQVQTCMSDSGDVVNDAVREACRQFDGVFNETTGSCENISGVNGIVKKFISDYFCTATGTGCAHPYDNLKCPDTYGHNNFAVTHFDAGGNMKCSCMPIVCPNPANYCKDKVLGTNWCGTTCPAGTWDPVDYGPSPSSVCQGSSFTQTTSCGKTRPAVGTYHPGDYGPPTGNYCTGTSFIQTNSCGFTRSATGTKTCP